MTSRFDLTPQKQATRINLPSGPKQKQKQKRDHYACEQPALPLRASEALS